MIYGAFIQVDGLDAVINDENGVPVTRDKNGSSQDFTKMNPFPSSNVIIDLPNDKIWCSALEEASCESV
ncbi:uncharacterized protein PHALS_14971 [Plasmopara halstedii]|uniref:Uncharacterized protein n=1 Tax=Plasmopara halstedii TaxID=4781 RepID=A0A0P1AZT0_PLAHL|nr:uncharacterized protein PHALS_14971 [Plasmopara halstedii]CEG47228.1 hypothetical protein PHALS_14971 [Plasmopara halstedii]|eukprot:XP_024583597.1 hypothetical protein PHALS_14971 [Plasmopara halstedii]